MTELDSGNRSDVLFVLLKRLLAGHIVNIESIKGELHGKFFGSTEAGEIVYRFRPFDNQNPGIMPSELLISSERLGGLTIERNHKNSELFDKAYKQIAHIYLHGSPEIKKRLLSELVKQNL